MENSIFDEKYFENRTREEWKQSGLWTKFIGVTLLVFSFITILMLILILLNQDTIADQLRELTGMSVESEAFLSQGGIWLFSILILVVFSVLVYNAICLIRFNHSTKQYAIHPAEDVFHRSFLHLKRYFTITLILGIISLVVSVISTIYTILYTS